jgi:hypothetical protein
MKRTALFLATLFVLLAATGAPACPLCKDSIPESDAPQAASVPGGFNGSIFAMLGSLFAVMGGVGWMVVKGIRDADKSPQESARPK